MGLQQFHFITGDRLEAAQFDELLTLGDHVTIAVDWFQRNRVNHITFKSLDTVLEINGKRLANDPEKGKILVPK